MAEPVQTSFLALAVVGGLAACSPADPPGPAVDPPPAEGSSTGAPEVVLSPADEPKEPRRIRVADSPVKAEVGERLAWTISSSSMSIDPRHRTEWSAATASGSALVRIDARHHASDREGDSERTTYVFEAAEPGTAWLSSSASKPMSAVGIDKEDAEAPEDLRIEVIVTAREE